MCIVCMGIVVWSENKINVSYEVVNCHYISGVGSACIPLSIIIKTDGFKWIFKTVTKTTSVQF